MSDLAERDRMEKQGWAAPGGAHDRLVTILKIALPALIGVLMAYLALIPLAKNKELSFVLDKNKVEVAKERLKVSAAHYQGEDNKGRPFALDARSAVQATSRERVVDVSGITGHISLDDGPATFRANEGRYNLDGALIDVPGAVFLTAADGYQLQTGNVAVDLNGRTMHSLGHVDGVMPIGRFSSDSMTADLAERNVVLTGRARLHIAQGRIR